MLKTFEKIYSYLVIERPVLAIVAVLILVGIASLGLPNVKLDASSDSLTLESDRALDFFREINNRYNSGSILVVTYQVEGDLFSEDSLRTLASLRDDLAQLDRVENVQSIVDVPLLYSPIVGLSGLSSPLPSLLDQGVDLALARQEFHINPIYRDTLVSADNQTTAVLINLEVDREAIELVRERDALLLQDSQGLLTADEQQRLEQVGAEYLVYRTETGLRDTERVQQVRAIADQYRDRANIFVGGADMITADMLTFIRSDMINFGLGIFVFIVITLAIIFRQFKLLILPLINCAFSLTIMLGFLGWIDWRLSVISSNFTLILMIVTLALSVHLIVRFQENCRKAPDSPLVARVQQMAMAMVRPCFYTVLTTMVAFVSLVVSDIRPVIDFGWMMTIGICIALMQTFFLIPAGLLLMGGCYKGGNAAEPQYTLVFARFADRRKGLVFTLAISLALISLYGLSRLTVENRFIDYFKSTTEIYQGMEVIDRNLGGTMSLDIIIDAPLGWDEEPIVQEVAVDSVDDLFSEDSFSDDLFADDPFADDPFADDPFAEDDLFGDGGFGEADESAQTSFSYWWNSGEMATIEAMHSYLESLPDIGKVNSLATATEMAADQTGSKLNDIELIFLRQNLGENLENTLINAYLDDSINQTRIATRVKETGDQLQRDALIEQVQNYAVQELGLAPEQVRVTGLIVLYNNMLQSLFGSQIQTLVAVFLGIMAMFALLFRSIPVSIIAITPNFLAAGIVLGSLGLFGVPLDLMTITIAAISVGMGVDNSIHYIHRFRSELAVDGDYKAAMYRAHSTIGRALIYTAITIIAGFSLLALSNFMPSIYFGLFTSLAMAAALVGSLTLLPAMLVFFKPFKLT